MSSVSESARPNLSGLASFSAKEKPVRVLKGLCALVCFVLIPAAASAQASIAGVAKDSSGAVLPGVTVEAASPALIEKVRSS